MPAAGPAERELLNRYAPAFEQLEGPVAMLCEGATLRMPPQPALSGGGPIARFLCDPLVGGDLTRIRHRTTAANGGPAVTIEVRA